jgi:type II secretory pathway component PulL
MTQIKCFAMIILPNFFSIDCKERQIYEMLIGMIIVSHSNLKFTVFWGCALLLILLVVSSSISVAEARNNHAKEENKQQQQQQQQLQQTNSCQGDRPLCIASNVAKMILCEHAICMIGP